jgi:microcin C transport system permease protein
MLGYTIRRLLLIIPTLISIFTVNFFIVQMAPGGPVDQVLAEMRGLDSSMAMERLSGQGGEDIQEQTQIDDFEEYSGARGLDPKIIAEIEKRFGFDKPIHERYFTTLWNYLRFDFGESFFRGGSVIDLVVERIPVSVSLGLWTMLLTYLISIPLGIRKAVKEGTPFDTWTSLIVSVGRAVPAFLFAILLIVLFAGGSFLDLFPIKGLVSRGWEDFPWWQQILDYFWHLTLPVIAMTIGSFAFLTIFTKNNFLEEISKQYVVTARAKGNTEKNILYKHVFRNSMLLVIAGFPSAFISLFFTGSLLIETMFTIDGLGYLGFTSVLQRDYPVMFGTLFLFSLIGLVSSLLGDLTMMMVDPRLDFKGRG